MQQATYIEPSDFPFKWESPEEREFTWVWDDVHTAIPNTPLTIAVNALRGLRPATTSSPGSASARPMRRVINGFAYSVRTPQRAVPIDAEERRKALDTLRDARRLWDQELLPTLIREIEAMKATELKGATHNQLLKHLDSFLEYYQNHWRIHGQAVGPVFTCTGFLVPIYEIITGSTDEAEPYRLLQGFDNKSLEVDRELRQLANRARDTVNVASAFDAAALGIDIIRPLKETDDGRIFLTHLQDFLETYGHCSNVLDFSEPTWLEQPDFVLLTIKGLLHRNLEPEKESINLMSQERDQLVRQALDRVLDNVSLKDEFLDILSICQSVWPIREDHAFYIEQASGSQMRRILVECGLHLAQENVIDSDQDVFYLTLEELKEALSDPQHADLKGITQSRRDERDRFMRVTPPQFLGKAPSHAMLSDNSESSKFIRAVSVPLTEERPSLLRGAAGSPGQVSGIARIVESPEDFWRIQPGDILICRSTSPPWTPIFSVIGGLVTDAGGVLSHGAIVAREYRLPAVMGTKVATRIIQDGQMISLDGNAGIIHLQ
jgi:phosphohistidine swiveling domain-containing protein